MNELVRRILWTGGFDSTWLTIDALLDGYRVQARTWRGYGMRNGWQKADNEDEARRRIIHALPSDLAQRLEVDVEADPHVWSSMNARYDEIAERVKTEWGAQNYLLAALPTVMGKGWEIGVVRDDGCDPEMIKIHHEHGLTTPILKMTKQQILTDARKRGFAKVLYQTWSCEGSVADCGNCEPCRNRIIRSDIGRVNLGKP